MKLFSADIEEGLHLADKVNAKYKPVFDKLLPNRRAALAWYFLPHKSKKETLNVTRPKIIKWYCPFADQKDFPTGHRYCINVYTGCSHQCHYCYAQGYEPDLPNCKANYHKHLLKDLNDIQEYNLPPAPVHISNSTDPLQPLELNCQHTLYTLQQLIRYRKYFTTITILTKNPAILAAPEYTQALRSLITPKLQLRIEVSLAFNKQSDVDFYEPGSPSIKQRKQAIIELRKNNIPVVLRIDPLLPRNPLGKGKLLEDFGLPNAQSLDDLNSLVTFAADNGIMHIVYSVAKIIQPRFKPVPISIAKLKQTYEHITSPNKLIFKGGSWRLPNNIAQPQIIDPFLNICKSKNINPIYCKQNLLSTH